MNRLKLELLALPGSALVGFYLEQHCGSTICVLQALPESRESLDPTLIQAACKRIALDRELSSSQDQWFVYWPTLYFGERAGIKQWRFGAEGFATHSSAYVAPSMLGTLQDVVSPISHEPLFLSR